MKKRRPFSCSRSHSLVPISLSLSPMNLPRLSSSPSPFSSLRLLVQSWISHGVSKEIKGEKEGEIKGNVLSSSPSRLFSKLNLELNRLTGYDVCEKLKDAVHVQNAFYMRAKERLSESQSAYQRAVDERATSQKEINALLQRKSSWLDDELNRFTELYRLEMRQETGVARARSELAAASSRLENAHAALMDTLRERYQVEQLWSDKIRRASTFGTFGLIALNGLIFLAHALFIEPRRRLALQLALTDALARQSLAVSDALRDLEAKMTAVQSLSQAEPLLVIEAGSDSVESTPSQQQQHHKRTRSTIAQSAVLGMASLIAFFFAYR